MLVNIVNCYYKPDPATTVKNRIASIDKNTKSNISPNPVYNILGEIYIHGNYVEGSSSATKDNWTYGVFNQFASKNGIIDTQKAVGGWPKLKSLKPSVDTDGDGMPDYWEKKFGLDPQTKNNEKRDLSSSYDNIEVYINSLVNDITEGER